MLSKVLTWMEPSTDVSKDRLMFTNLDLKQLIIPLVVEQVLSMMVGLVDTMMISYAGEAAVSGVSLVDMINNFFIFVFSATATGGAVVVAQYIGNQEIKKGRLAASQLVMLGVVIALILSAISMIFCNQILGLLFGNVESAVMEASRTYLLISAVSYPFLALYNGCAALFRSMRLTKVTMYVSIIMNLINVAGNSVGIFVLHWGVAGVAIASLLSRLVAGLVMYVMSLNQKRQIYIKPKDILSVHPELIGRIGKIAIPNGIENGLFHLSKIVLTRIIALFGTAQIAANGVANSIDYVGAIIVSAVSLAVVTVAGQCAGAGDHEQVIYYIKKLLRISLVSSVLLDGLIILLLPVILKFYALSSEATRLTYILVILHNVFICTFYPYSGIVPNGMRAAGDVKFTMYVSIFATAVCRVVFSYLFGVLMGMGIIGVWLAMGVDWAIRSAFFFYRFKSGAWKNFQVI